MAQQAQHHFVADLLQPFCSTQKQCTLLSRGDSKEISNLSAADCLHLLACIKDFCMHIYPVCCLILLAAHSSSLDAVTFVEAPHGMSA